MDESPEVVITRDHELHSWCVVNGSHHAKLPWNENADVVSVIYWLKGKADGPLTVKVQT
jgi:hypothetical protein